MKIYTTNYEGSLINFSALADEFLEERHLLQQSARELEDQFNNSLSALAIVDDRVVAHATLWHLLDNWYELGSVWVCKSMRGNGIATELYKAIFSTNIEKDILITTTNPYAMRVGQKAGAVAISRRQLQTSVWRTSCICSSSKTGGSAKTCILAYCESGRTLQSSCLFAVSPQTALKNSLEGIDISI